MAMGYLGQVWGLTLRISLMMERVGLGAGECGGKGGGWGKRGGSRYIGGGGKILKKAFRMIFSSPRPSLSPTFATFSFHDTVRNAQLQEKAVLIKNLIGKIDHAESRSTGDDGTVIHDKLYMDKKEMVSFYIELVKMIR